MAGSPCPEQVMRKVIDRMHMEDVTICYGMTETSPVSTQTSADDALERRVGTVGRVHPHVEVKIVEPETGRTVERGEPGELCTRGYSVMLGYWEDPERTAEAIDPARWMHTGDLATMDDEGYVKIVGRSKDMIIRGGENVYPREIEEFLYTHDAIADAPVYGVPDPRYGEAVMASVILREGASLTEDELREYCAGKIAHYKVPRYVIFVDEFPMTVTGKIQKFKMRDEAVEALGLAEAPPRLAAGTLAAWTTTTRPTSPAASPAALPRRARGARPRPRRSRPAAARAALEREVRYGSTGPDQFVIDAVPRMFTREEWDTLDRGLAQRVRALDAFLRDAYGERRIVEAGVVPDRLIGDGAFYEPDMQGVELPVWAGFAGLDVVRGADGEFNVLEDNVRMPTGLGFAPLAWEAASDLIEGLPERSPGADESMERFAARPALGGAGRPRRPSIVVLGDGFENDAQWEISDIAFRLGVPMVTLDDLRQREGRVYAHVDGRRREVDVIYRRSNFHLLRDEDARPARSPRSCSAFRRGSPVVNPPGVGSPTTSSPTPTSRHDPLLPGGGAVIAPARSST